MSSRILDRNPNLLTIDGQKSRLSPEVQKLTQKLLLGETKLSYSAFSKFMESPDMFLRYKLDKTFERTPSMVEGSLVHLLVLEPQNFDRDYVFDFEGKTPSGGNQIKFADQIRGGADVVDAYTMSYSTKGKSADKVATEAGELAKELAPYLEWYKTIGNRVVISTKTYEHCYRCAEAVLENGPAWEILSQVFAFGGSEKSAEWSHGGYEWRGFLDGYCPAMIADLKKCPDADPAKIRRQITFDGWGAQAALYSIATDGFKIPYYLIAVDNDYQVSVTLIPTAARVEKIQHLNWYINRFTECLIDPSQFRKSFDFYSQASDGIYTY